MRAGKWYILAHSSACLYTYACRPICMVNKPFASSVALAQRSIQLHLNATDFTPIPECKIAAIPHNGHALVLRRLLSFRGRL